MTALERTATSVFAGLVEAFLAHTKDWHFSMLLVWKTMQLHSVCCTNGLPRRAIY